MGQHQIMYTPTHEGAETYDDKPRPSPYTGFVLKSDMIEITPGRNTVEVELIAPARRRT